MKYGVSKELLATLKKVIGTGSINIFGLPLSGKDTQGKRLADLLNAPLIGGGDIIRSSDRDDVKAIIARGQLAPTNDYVAMITPYFSKSEFADKPLILSSVGRWHGEEKAIQEAAHKGGHPQKAVIFLSMPDDTLRARLEIANQNKDRGHREDDQEAYLVTRLNEFNTKTKPVLDYYQKQGLLIEIDGTKEPDEVTQAIVRALVSHV